MRFIRYDVPLGNCSALRAQVTGVVTNFTAVSSVNSYTSIVTGADAAFVEIGVEKFIPIVVRLLTGNVGNIKGAMQIAPFLYDLTGSVCGKVGKLLINSKLQRGMHTIRKECSDLFDGSTGFKYH